MIPSGSLKKLKMASSQARRGSPSWKRRSPKLKGNSSTSRGNTLPGTPMYNMLRGSANASSRKKYRKKNTSNNAGMKWHTANIT